MPHETVYRLRTSAHVLYFPVDSTESLTYDPGSGTVGGVVIGALRLGVINMGMSIMGLPDAWKYVSKGGVLLIAVIFDVVTSRKSGSK